MKVFLCGDIQVEVDSVCDNDRNALPKSSLTAYEKKDALIAILFTSHHRNGNLN